MKFYYVFLCIMLALTASGDQTEDKENDEHPIFLTPMPAMLKTTTYKPPVVNRHDPDSFFFGFYPLWSAMLFMATLFCFLVSLSGVICYCLGCRNPQKEFFRQYNDSLEKPTMSDVDTNNYYDDVEIESKLAESMDRTSSRLFQDSRLMSECEMDPILMAKEKKKIFKRDHL